MKLPRNPFRRKSRRPTATKVDEPIAFYLGGDGRMQAVKSSGYATSPYSRIPISHLWSNSDQYARAAIASVWAANCINLRSDTIARLDWHVRDRKTLEVVEDHPFEIALAQSKQNIIRRLEKSQLTHGETFIKPLHNKYGYASALYILNNLDVEIDISYGYVQGFTYTPQGAGGTHHYTPQELVYIHNENEFDDNHGLSKFEHVLIEIGIDVDISRTTRSFYANDARPGLLLFPEQDMTKEIAEEFMESWNAQFKGPDRAGKTVLAPKVLREVKEFQRAPSIDDVELRESTRREVCAAFKVPLSMAGAWDAATYQSLPEQRKAFYEETVIPAAEGHARELTKYVLPLFEEDSGFEVFFDASVILALTENTLELVDISTRKLNSGGYTINEFRVSLGDDSIDGGDIHIIQSGWIPVRSEDLATFEAPNTAQAPEEPMMAMQDGDDVVFGDAPPEPIRAHDHTHVPDEDIEVKTIHAAALKELRSWQKFVGNGNATKREFHTFMICDDIAEPLNAIIEGGEASAIKAAFKIAETQIAIKTSDKIRRDFEKAIKALISDAQSGKATREQFKNRLTAIVQNVSELAFLGGLTDGGVIVNEIDEITTEEAAIFKSILSKQLAFVQSLTKLVFDKGLSSAQVALKPRQWYAKTVLPIYDAALVSAARNQMVEIIGPIDENSCESCKALVGQRHRRKAIMRAGLMPPYGSRIICSDGGLCKHRVISVNSRARGHLSRVPRK